MANVSVTAEEARECRACEGQGYLVLGPLHLDCAACQGTGLVTDEESQNMLVTWESVSSQYRVVRRFRSNFDGGVLTVEERVTLPEEWRVVRGPRGGIRRFSGEAGAIAAARKLERAYREAQEEEEREYERKRRANFNAVADGFAPPYPSEY